MGEGHCRRAPHFLLHGAPRGGPQRAIAKAAPCRAGRHVHNPAASRGVADLVKDVVLLGSVNAGLVDDVEAVQEPQL